MYIHAVEMLDIYRVGKGTAHTGAYHLRSQSDASVPMSIHRQEIALTAHVLQTKHFQYLVSRPYDLTHIYEQIVNTNAETFPSVTTSKEY